MSENNYFKVLLSMLIKENLVWLTCRAGLVRMDVQD
jgi:hypothetical protein